ncbi:MAG: redox-regulated ATPase YchF [Planctomycetes bacterium]|nr:redox-regulated ATPase YchF [Planctomycetota bacterium]
MQLALLGIPGTGVKTLFSAITGLAEPAGAYTGAPGQARVAVVKVPDERLLLLSSVYRPKKTTPATVELVEFPGLFGGPAVDARVVAKARESDALVIVLRTFESQVAPHLLGAVDPKRDLARIDSEMALADLAILEARLDRLEKNLKRNRTDEDLAEKDILLRCRAELEAGRSVRDARLSDAERRAIRSFRFLTEKPAILMMNIGENQIGQEEALMTSFKGKYEVQAICGSLESELARLGEAERADFMKDFGVQELAAPVVLHAAYRILEVVTFFTYGEDECRAWNVRRGDTVVEAAGRIHTDLAKGFIRAEVVSFEDFRQYGDMKGVKAAGKFRLEGRDHLVQEGDIIIIRHSN